MKALTALVLAAGLISPSAAAAQTADPVDVTEFVLGEFCLPLLLDEGELTPERIAESAENAGLTAMGDVWGARLGENSGLLFKWDHRLSGCIMNASGVPEFKDPLQDLFRSVGFVHRQQLVEPDGTIGDLWCAKIQGYDPTICAVIYRYDDPGDSGSSMSMLVMRAPG